MITYQKPHPKFEGETFEEWFKRWGLPYCERQEEIDALIDEFAWAPVIPAERTSIPDEQGARRRHRAAIRWCRKRFGVLYETSGGHYFVDPVLWYAAKLEFKL